MTAPDNNDATLAQMFDQMKHETTDNYISRLQAALLAAQQDATRWQNRATLLGQERQRAEATITQLRLWGATDLARARGLAEALAHPITKETREGSTEEIATEIVALLADPLAQDAEQNPAGRTAGDKAGANRLTEGVAVTRDAGAGQSPLSATPAQGAEQENA